MPPTVTAASTHWDSASSSSSASVPVRNTAPAPEPASPASSSPGPAAWPPLPSAVSARPTKQRTMATMASPHRDPSEAWWAAQWSRSACRAVTTSSQRRADVAPSMSDTCRSIAARTPLEPARAMRRRDPSSKPNRRHIASAASASTGQRDVFSSTPASTRRERAAAPLPAERFPGRGTHRQSAVEAEPSAAATLEARPLGAEPPPVLALEAEACWAELAELAATAAGGSIGTSI
mmetsp:Transcript_2682/g.10713  ORF Transcript_2682/g.10713 Transcript_2682/m.10713 type:complete len:235 (+) Transcript_2682:271-975(+)